MSAIEHYNLTNRKKDREISLSLSFFWQALHLCPQMRMLNLSICLALPHTARLDIFALLRNIFAKAANSIYFRYAQIRYDINPRSRSEHIELLMAHSCHQQYIERRRRISKIRSSGFISMWTCSMAGPPMQDLCLIIYFFNYKLYNQHSRIKKRDSVWG